MIGLVEILDSLNKKEQAAFLEATNQKFQVEQSRRILLSFFDSAGGKLFDPRMIAKYLNDRTNLNLALFQILKSESSLKKRIQVNQKKIAPHHWKKDTVSTVYKPSP